MVVGVGSESELIERVKHQKSIWMNGGLSRFLRDHQGKGHLVRAVNYGELRQLVKNGPENFLFHAGANFGFDYYNHVVTYAAYRSGTIVVSLFEERDIAMDKKEISDEKRIIYHGGSTGSCLKDFRASVEVYNVRGFDWDRLSVVSSRDDVELMDNCAYL